MSKPVPLWRIFLGVTIFIVLVAIVTISATHKVEAQTSPLTWRFVTTGDKLYIASGSQEFVTEVDTSRLPVKYYLNPQLDDVGNIYLLSVASNDRDTNLANYDRRLSIYYTRTEGQTTSWYEITAESLELDPSSGIYDLAVYGNTKNLAVIGKNGEVFFGNQVSGRYQFRLIDTVAVLPVTPFTRHVGRVGLLVTSQGLAPLFTDPFRPNTKYLSDVQGPLKGTLSLGFGVSFYAYPDSRDPSMPNRNEVYAFDEGKLLATMKVSAPVISFNPVGEHNHYLVWTADSVLMMERIQKEIEPPFGSLPPTDITRQLELSGHIVDVAAYGTGDITNSPTHNEGLNITFYVATDNGKVKYFVIEDEGVTTAKDLKLSPPAYKINGNFGITSGSSIAPTPVDPKEAVPGQPGVSQGNTQPGATQASVNQPPSNQADTQVSEDNRSTWSTLTIVSVLLALVALVAFAIIARAIFRRATKNRPLPQPKGATPRSPRS